MRVAGYFQNFDQGEYRARGPNTKTPGGKASTEPAMMGNPFQRVSDGTAIDDTRANATHGVPNVQLGYGLGITGADPAECHEYRADSQHQAGADDVDQVTFKRNEPGFQKDEQRECPLNGDQRDVQVGLDGFGEKRPGILQIGDRHHRDNAGDQLNPAIDD